MIVIVDCGSKKTKELANMVKKAGYENLILNINNLEQINNKAFSGVVISGAPILLTEVNKENYIQKFDFIKNLDIPVLGICFGHQIIGLLYGAHITKGEGIRRHEGIKIITNDKLFSNLERECTFVEDHCEFITLPEDFYHLARSESCEIESMKHKTKVIYGVQFHPEVSGENGVKLLKNFCSMV